MREKRKGYPKIVSIGYKNPINKKPILVKNISELEKVKDNAVIIGNIGKKKKIEIAKKAKEMKISVQNLNVKEFLKNFEKVNKNTNKK